MSLQLYNLFNNGSIEKKILDAHLKIKEKQL